VERDDNQRERAIAILSFSCDEASMLRPVSTQYIRANLFVSLYLLRPIVQNNHEYCHLTRILSFDLGGNINQHLSNAICTQQANLPVVIAEYLLHNPSNLNNNLGPLLTNESLVSKVFHPLHETPDTDIVPNGIQGISSATATCGPANSVPSKKVINPATVHIPAVELQFITLMSPVIVYWLFDHFNVAGTGFIFCCCAFLSIRQVVCWHIGNPLAQNDDPSVLGPVTCRFRVDLKGILRFISNRKEERLEMKSNRTDISIVHIVASALAHAFKKEPLLHTRKVSIPWLLIHRIVDASTEPVNVSVSENAGGIVTLPCADQYSIQDIADLHRAADARTDKTHQVGQCLILAMSNYDEGDMITDAAPLHRDVTVVAVLGGVHLERSEKLQPKNNNGRKESPKPVLSLSLTIAGTHQSADIVTCRRFADEVRKLLVYPEICEKMDSPVKVG
jgi:hypothetical protein